jgi:hypothetical protein
MMALLPYLLSVDPADTGNVKNLCMKPCIPVKMPRMTGHARNLP